MPFHYHHTEGQGIVGDWVWRDGHWRHDPDLPTPITVADYDPNATRYDLPAVGRADYAGYVSYTHPVVPVLDVGDVIGLYADDPTPDEITDPDHHDYVEPWTGT